MSEHQTEVVKFLNYLSNPNALGSDDLVEIKDWVSKYPYSQSLKFIAAKAAEKSTNYQDLLAQAATIAPSRKTLHHLIHQPENFSSSILPFSIDDEQTIQERQTAVSSEENLEGVEDQSKLSFGINLNEIYGSEYQTEKIEEESEIENTEDETQESEEVIANADAEQLEEDIAVESIEEETQAEEVSVITHEEEVEEIVADISVENIEEETQENKEEVLTTADEEQVEKVQETEVENIEDEAQESEVVSASADENHVAEVEEIVEETSVESIQEETQAKEVLAAADEEQVEEAEAEKIEDEAQESEFVSANTDEEHVSEVKEIKEETSIENIEDEAQESEEVSALADEEQVVAVEEIEEETQVEITEEESQLEEVSAIADEKQVEEIQETEQVPEVENLEDEAQESEVVSVSTDEEHIAEAEEIKEETSIENIKEESQTEEVIAIADEEQVEEIQETEQEPEVENIEEEVSVITNEQETEEVLETEQESEVENIQEEIVEDEDPLQKKEPAFQYAPQTDFFALNRKDKLEEKKAEESVEKVTNTDESVAAYNDERMPYTFLWWLNKTRKEHANTQPYSSFKLDTSRQIKKQETDGLNHQIAENIFHLRGVEELSSSAANYTVPFDFRKKEFQIIEKFIKEEPQIRPPAANKIDSENKAKKSSEDNNQVVSETLAKIYVEQMLYHKALDVYKKLSLKYPEKSTYFASQIKYLELKVN